MAWGWGMACVHMDCECALAQQSAAVCARVWGDTAVAGDVHIVGQEGNVLQRRLVTGRGRGVDTTSVGGGSGPGTGVRLCAACGWVSATCHDTGCASGGSEHGCLVWVLLWRHGRGEIDQSHTRLGCGVGGNESGV